MTVSFLFLNYQFPKLKCESGEWTNTRDGRRRRLPGCCLLFVTCAAFFSTGGNYLQLELKKILRVILLIHVYAQTCTQAHRSPPLFRRSPAASGHDASAAAAGPPPGWAAGPRLSPTSLVAAPTPGARPSVPPPPLPAGPPPTEDDGADPTHNPNRGMHVRVLQPSLAVLGAARKSRGDDVEENPSHDGALF